MSYMIDCLHISFEMHIDQWGSKLMWACVCFFVCLPVSSSRTLMTLSVFHSLCLSKALMATARSLKGAELSGAASSSSEVMNVQSIWSGIKLKQNQSCATYHDCIMHNYKHVNGYQCFRTRGGISPALASASEVRDSASASEVCDWMPL